MNKFAIYVRVSTQRQGASGLGLEAQKEICINYINSVNGECLQLFKDVESGKSRIRQGLSNAIEFCKANGCTLVIAKLDRLARDVEFTFRVINTGIDIHFCDMPSVNTMVLGVFASVAQYERELISKRTKDAFRAKVTRGEQMGGCTGVWGKNLNVEDKDWYREQCLQKASEASVEKRKEIARNNVNNKEFKIFIDTWMRYNGEIQTTSQWEEIVTELNSLGRTTSTGMSFTVPRAKSMYNKIKSIY